MKLRDSRERQRVILVGAGRYAAEVSDLAAAAGVEVAGWVEGLDRSRCVPGRVPAIVWAEDQAGFEPELPIVPAIGSIARVPLIEQLVAAGRRLTSLVHPSAIIAATAVVEPGCVIGATAVVGAAARIGRGTILSRGVLVGHHTSIGAHSFLGPGANVAGGVIIGTCVSVGIGAIVRNDIRVGDRAVIGAGAVVVRDIPANVTLVGVRSLESQLGPGKLGPRRSPGPK